MSYDITEDFSTNDFFNSNISVKELTGDKLVLVVDGFDNRLSNTPESSFLGEVVFHNVISSIRKIALYGEESNSNNISGKYDESEVCFDKKLLNVKEFELTGVLLKPRGWIESWTIKAEKCVVSEN